MWLAKRILCGVMIGGWATLALGAETTPSGRGDWERRVLRDVRVKPTSSVTPVESPLLAEPDSGYDDIQLDPVSSGGMMMSDGDSCGTSGAGVGCQSHGIECESCGEMGCGHHCGWLRDFSLFGGVQGFKGPADLGSNGNFGFHEGFNFGAPLGGPWGLGCQLGLQGVHSNLSGDNVLYESRADRDQIFFTGGVFRRAVCGGLQWGVVFDMMHDNYYQKVDLNQFRAEVSWVRPGCREIGFWGSFGSKNAEAELPGEQVVHASFEQTDLFAFFYRRYFCNGGEGRLWAGFTGQHDGLIGGDIRIPIGGSWALENSFNYLIPEESRGINGVEQEAWKRGPSVGLVPRSPCRICPPEPVPSAAGRGRQRELHGRRQRLAKDVRPS